jgi:hypothetical protein
MRMGVRRSRKPGAKLFRVFLESNKPLPEDLDLSGSNGTRPGPQNHCVQCVLIDKQVSKVCFDRNTNDPS